MDSAPVSHFGFSISFRIRILNQARYTHPHKSSSFPKPFDILRPKSLIENSKLTENQFLVSTERNHKSTLPRTNAQRKNGFFYEKKSNLTVKLRPFLAAGCGGLVVGWTGVWTAGLAGWSLNGLLIWLVTSCCCCCCCFCCCCCCCCCCSCCCCCCCCCS